MRISRLFIPHSLNVGQQIGLQEHSAHYVRTVLRLKKMRSPCLMGGEGGIYALLLKRVEKRVLNSHHKSNMQRNNATERFYRWYMRLTH